MLLGLSNALCLPIITFTSEDRWPYVCFHSSTVYAGECRACILLFFMLDPDISVLQCLMTPQQISFMNHHQLLPLQWRALLQLLIVHAYSLKLKVQAPNKLDVMVVAFKIAQVNGRQHHFMDGSAG